MTPSGRVTPRRILLTVDRFLPIASATSASSAPTSSMNPSKSMHALCMGAQFVSTATLRPLMACICARALPSRCGRPDVPNPRFACENLSEAEALPTRTIRAYQRIGTRTGIGPAPQHSPPNPAPGARPSAERMVADAEAAPGDLSGDRGSERGGGARGDPSRASGQPERARFPHPPEENATAEQAICVTSQT